MILKYCEKEGLKSADGMTSSEIKQGYKPIDDDMQPYQPMMEELPKYGFLGYRNTNGRQR